MATGEGQGTPIVVIDPGGVYDQMEELTTTPNCAVSLSRYAKLIGYEEASFWGVKYENQFMRGCDPLWNEYQRMSIANALAEAQQEIEQVIGYPLCPTYISGTYNDNPRWYDQQEYKWQTVTRYPRILDVGIPSIDIIENGSVINYNLIEGMGVIGPIATSATSADQIKIYYPDSDRQITPSKITIVDGEATIEVPRYRMVKQEFLNFVEGGVDYKVLGNFIAEVDVKRLYTDTTTQAILAQPNCKNNSCRSGCNECTQTGCIYIRDSFLGIVNVTPANWNEDLLEWRTDVSCRKNYKLVRLNYLAGVKKLDLQAEMVVIRLAHSKMGKPPCSCDKTMGMWSKDYDTAGAVTRERVNCPFGLSNGAWTAYKWALTMASKRASIL